MSTAICQSENENGIEHYTKLREVIAEAERRAINKHKYTMSEQYGCEVGFDEAMQDWNEKCAKTWRENRLRKMLYSQREEINRFKWIASELAGEDLGRSAVEEWIHKHGPGWRFNWEEAHIDADTDVQSAG